MADTEALRVAEAVNEKAEALSSEVDSEVQAMVRAIQQGENTLDLIEQIERAIGDHAQYLKAESQKSQVMQQQALETLQSMDKISSQLTELILPHLLEPPTEASLPSKSSEPATFPSLPDFHVPNREELESSQLTELILPHLLEPPTEASLPSKSSEPATFPSLPDFHVPNREELESIPLSSLQHNEAAWDMLAQDFTTFEEQIETSLQEAEQLAQVAQEKLREVEKHQQPDKTVQQAQKIKNRN
jgi:hypothetical protein